MTKLKVVVGGQYGSEAKGHVAGYLATRAHDLLCIRVSGPNAGHSVVNPATGIKHALRQIPVGAVTNPNAQLAIAAGSEVDYEVLADEIARLEADGIKLDGRLHIDPQATVLTHLHRINEAANLLTRRLGSTGKGVGAARSSRIMRDAMTIGQMQASLPPGVTVMPTTALMAAGEIHIEGTQGYGLGLHAGHYPYCTSGDCTAIDFMAAAQVSPWQFDYCDLQVWVVFRPYPIRVAGNSGPLHGETTWEALGLPPEYTTVTKKMRRVGTWDASLARHAILANGGPAGRSDSHRSIRVALTMADQLDPSIAESQDLAALYDSRPVTEFMARVKRDTGCEVALVTTSDYTCIDLGYEPPF